MITNKPEAVAWLHSVRQDSDVITDKVRHVWGAPRGSMGEYTVPLIRLSDYEALQVECEKLRKDADRYRALRSMHWYDSPLAVVCNPKAAIKPGSYCPSVERLDAAIDAAMEKTQ